jgi:hypothetical protein
MPLTLLNSTLTRLSGTPCFCKLDEISSVHAPACGSSPVDSRRVAIEALWRKLLGRRGSMGRGISAGLRLRLFRV